MKIKNKTIGGNIGYSTNLDPIGGNPSYKGYTTSSMPVYEGELLNNSDLTENVLDDDLKYFNIINDSDSSNLIRGGAIGNKRVKEPLGQFTAIKKISLQLVKLSVDELSDLVTLIILHEMSINILMKDKYESKCERLNKIKSYADDFKETMKNLGKNNLIVLASLLLLHHYANEKRMNDYINSDKESSSKIILIKKIPEIQTMNRMLYKSANNILNKYGKEDILGSLERSFSGNPIIKSGKYQRGGNLLSSYIAPLGSEAFVATGLLVLLEKIIKNKFSHITTKRKDNKKKYGGLVRKKVEKLGNILDPISFSTFINKVRKVA